MKYVIASVVCACLFVVYVLISVAAGWKHGGGLIPMALFIGIAGFAWKAIAGQSKKTTAVQSKKSVPSSEKTTVEKRPFVGFQDIPKSRGPSATPKSLSSGRK